LTKEVYVLGERDKLVNLFALSTSSVQKPAYASPRFMLIRNKDDNSSPLCTSALMSVKSHLLRRVADKLQNAIQILQSFATKTTMSKGAASLTGVFAVNAKLSDGRNRRVATLTPEKNDVSDSDKMLVWKGFGLLHDVHTKQYEPVRQFIFAYAYVPVALVHLLRSLRDQLSTSERESDEYLSILRSLAWVEQNIASRDIEKKEAFSSFLIDETKVFSKEGIDSLACLMEYVASGRVFCGSNDKSRNGARDVYVWTCKQAIPADDTSKYVAHGAFGVVVSEEMETITCLEKDDMQVPVSFFKAGPAALMPGIVICTSLAVLQSAVAIGSLQVADALLQLGSFTQVVKGAEEHGPAELTRAGSELKERLNTPVELVRPAQSESRKRPRSYDVDVEVCEDLSGDDLSVTDSEIDTEEETE